MKRGKKRNVKFIVTVDPRLDNVEMPQWAIEKLKEANEFLRHARLPDEYYKQVGIEPPKAYKGRFVPFEP
jgi:hypothetical protein